MKLTIEQALQQGMITHKEGNVQEAERLYRAILQPSVAKVDPQPRFKGRLTFKQPSDTKTDTFQQRRVD